MPKFCCKHFGAIHEAVPFCYGLTIGGWHYTITCPVCGDTHDFLREEPFPTDVDIDLENIPNRVV